jgi:galactitol-specific phosphotransferase system IIC component
LLQVVLTIVLATFGSLFLASIAPAVEDGMANGVGLVGLPLP